MSRRLLWAISVAAFCLSAASARADLVSFSISDTTLSYSVDSQHATIDGTDWSTLQASLSSGGTEIGSASIGNGFFASSTFVDLDFTGGSGSWSATGALTLTDTTEEGRIEAAFTSTGITVTKLSWMYYLTIEGTLRPYGSNETILVNSTPWTFEGDYDTINIDDPAGWSSGEFVSFNWAIGGVSDLDTFFASDQYLFGGETVFNVVPTPVAVLLGMLGMGVAGLKLRKFV
jgi:hypothetical protein